ncbi:unnamed protein product [Phytophthora fragariaefolia]|uniref:Unnamed protein product n=1 Tax=Phytophthora fragariaefolia TaxID=1490495 RepID=A0A9W7CW04_9STRA|nr:unnamed protein product [Phytophthora fragariaefolia]
MDSKHTIEFAPHRPTRFRSAHVQRIASLVLRIGSALRFAMARVAPSLGRRVDVRNSSASTPAVQFREIRTLAAPRVVRRYVGWSIVNHRGVPGAYAYRVVWAGYTGYGSRTWEPRAALLAEEDDFSEDLEIMDAWKDSGECISIARFCEERDISLSIEVDRVGRCGFMALSIAADTMVSRRVDPGSC